jgi:hypothetical protein
MKLNPIFILTSFFLLVLPTSAQQPAEECKAKITYENRNQIEYRPLSVSIVSGVALDKDQVPIPSVCLGLFTERGHRLVANAVTDQTGSFNFSRVIPGRYRLMAKYNGFCPANLSLRIMRRPSKSNRKGRHLVFHMQPTGMDSCSYGDYK